MVRAWVEVRDSRLARIMELQQWVEEHFGTATMKQLPPAPAEPMCQRDFSQARKPVESRRAPLFDASSAEEASCRGWRTLIARNFCSTFGPRMEGFKVGTVRVATKLMCAQTGIPRVSMYIL